MRKGSVGVIVTWVIVFLILFLFFVFSKVSYNEYGIKKTITGRLQKDVYNQGIHYVGLSSMIKVNNQIRTYEITIDAPSKDYQEVKTTLNLNIRIKKDKVYDFVKNYKSEEDYRNYLNNKVQEKIKVIMLRYSAEDILNKREQLRDEILKEIKGIPELDYFEIKDIVIKNIEFSPEFSEMLEKRASIDQEKVIIKKQKENLKLLKENIKEIDIDTYFKYKLIEKWNGKSDLIISDSLLRLNK